VETSAGWRIEFAVLLVRFSGPKVSRPVGMPSASAGFAKRRADPAEREGLRLPGVLASAQTRPVPRFVVVGHASSEFPGHLGVGTHIGALQTDPVAIGYK